jgi:hypothetical protein
MGCSTCGQAARAVQQGYKGSARFSVAAQIAASGPCEYTIPQLQVWVEKLTCFMQKGLYVQYGVKPADLNRALGGVKSAINYVTYPCYYAKELAFAQTILNIVISSGQC